MAKLLLFDIDGTLLDSGGAGIKALNDALEELTGEKNGFEGIECAGKTDISIIKEALIRWDLPAHNGAVEGFIDRYVRHLSKTIHNGKGHVKKGVTDLLARLQYESDMYLGLLTGNVEPGARIKLDKYELNSYFAIGAFGNDEENRNKLLPIARDRFFQNSGINVDFSDCIIIGDTPRDVECAQAFGALSLAVATGPYSREVLNETGATLVLEDLSNTDSVVRWINGN